jgi:hypothetical protein
VIERVQLHPSEGSLQLPLLSGPPLNKIKYFIGTFGIIVSLSIAIIKVTQIKNERKKT